MRLNRPWEQEQTFRTGTTPHLGPAQMIPHNCFIFLRLAQFIPMEAITQLDQWEYMDQFWVGEAVGFSEWLRPQNDPEALGSMALDFATLPQDVAEHILETLELPLRPGMSLGQIEAVLGHPNDTLAFTQDRKTYEFAPRAEYPYAISCTVRKTDGLTYLVVMRPTVIGERHPPS